MTVLFSILALIFRRQSVLVYNSILYPIVLILDYFLYVIFYFVDTGTCMQLL